MLWTNHFPMLTIALAVCLCTSAWGQNDPPNNRDRTSENHAGLKKLLEKQPQADVNKDGILTWEEALRARRNNRSNSNQQAAQNPAPTEANVAYDDHERHVLDFWRADSDRPTPLFIWIHGGGFRAGDKKSFPGALRTKCLQAGISCASIHYRLSGHAPYPAQMYDSARAVQFLRSKADQWNLDPKRFAAGGGSAGSGISQWLGYHDDLAETDSDDPIARQSTRLTCVFPINLQSTYDPREIKDIVPGKAYTHPALIPFFDRPKDWDWDRNPIDSELGAMLVDASPVTHLSRGDAPIFALSYARAATDGNIHHPNFGQHLKQSADKVGVECVVKLDTDYPSMTDAYADMVTFMKKHFQ